jgi:repressor LexA
MALTPKQKAVLDFVAQFLEERGFCPSFHEIAKGLNLTSLATVHKHVSILEAKGYLKRSYNHSRSLELTPRYFRETRGSQVETAYEVPLEGRIAAGTPVETFTNRTTLNFADFTGDKDTYALQVRGDSMIEDHICDGDYVLIERTSDVRDGDIVVALVGGAETTLKRFYQEGDMVRLQPANSSMEPIRVPAEDVYVQGRLLAVLRKFR